MDSVIEMELHSGKQLPPSPYVTLPPELLRAIFKACADPPSTEPGNWSWYDARKMQWIAITRVCRYWRSVALGYSDLWKRLRFFNPKITKEMIHRSQGANLEVIINASYRSIAKSTIIPMVLAELHRISMLHIKRLELLESLVNGLSAAPKLEYLYLSASEIMVFYIPDTIFSRETPALRSLELHSCTFTSPSPSSGTVSYPNCPIGHIPSTISQIVSFLRGAPMLHTLILDTVLPYADTGDAYPNLVLPKLSRLELTSSVASCTNFLEHIIFPVTTDVTVNCENPSQDGDYGRLFRAFLSAMGNSKTNFVISALKLTVKSRSRSRSNIVGIQCTISHSHQPAQTKVTFEFSMNFYNHELYRDILNTASVTLPLTNTHELDVVGFVPELVISFDSLANIHTIRFDSYEVVRAALADTHRLRSLRSLQFYRATFQDEDISTLMDSLKHRLISGFPIEYIRLDMCSDLEKADVMRMKEFVQDVEWDGVNTREELMERNRWSMTRVMS
jgi:F-box-like